MKDNERKGICGICSAGCCIIASYDETGKIISVRADETSPFGRICKIGENSTEIIYSKDRLLYPMKRKGKKGTLDFERITWDEAYEAITGKLNHIKDNYGAEATAIYTGVGSFELSMCDVFQPKGVAVSSASSVLFPFGSPNTMGVGALCYVAYGMIAPHVTMGRMFMNMYSDIENSELIIVWGANPATDLPAIDMERMIKAKNRGAKVIVIDPRKTATAELTDAEWIPIRPGTDGALALGLINIIIEEELYDEDFVENWTIGFDDLVRYVQHYRPEVVERITGVSKYTIIKLAKVLGTSKGVSQLMYTGMEFTNSGVQNIRATLILWALAGQIDVPGGLCFGMDNMFPINRNDLIENPDIGPRLGGDKFPVYIKYRDEAHAISLPDSVLNGDPYKIRSLIVLGGSITTSWPSSDVWKKTLNELDFLVAIDRNLSADSLYADIVLPATTYYENRSYVTYGAAFKIRERMIEPRGEARNDFFILSELAERLGYGHLYPQTEEELFKHVLKGSGYSLKDIEKNDGMVSVKTDMMQYKKWEKGLLRKDGKSGFETPSGKFEIASSILEDFGYDPLPKYSEPKESPLSKPELLKKYPLVFNSGSRIRTSINVRYKEIKNLNKKYPEPFVTMNTKDAGKRKIENGDRVIIRSPRGMVIQRALLTDNIIEGVVDLSHGGGSPRGPKAWQDSNVNLLTDIDNYDPISGFPVYKALLCEVEKYNDEKKLIMELDDIKLRKLIDSSEKLEKEDIYLDNNATTALSKEVLEYVGSLKNVFGNPSSIYERGKEASKIIEEGRRRIAKVLNCTAKRIVFTGCGSESNNLAIKGVAFSNINNKKHLITSKIEHPSVLNTFKWLEKVGYNVTYLNVDSTGMVNPDELRKEIRQDTCIVSIMMANNETGTIQKIEELAKIAKDNGAIFHTDAVQAFGKIPVNVEELGVDLLTISSHKIHGPKGVGALYIRKGIEIESLIHGGGQESGIRSGTENVLGIAGFGMAAYLIPKSLSDMERVKKLRNKLEMGIKKILPDSFINGTNELRLPNTLNMTIPEIRGESLVLEMSRSGIYFSSGSACHAGSSDPSHALLAMGLGIEDAHCSVRFSLSYHSQEEEIDKTIKLLKKIINDSKNIVRFVSCK